MKINYNNKTQSQESYRALVWRRFKRNRIALIGLSIIIFLLITSILAPLLAPYNPNAMNMGKSYLAPNSEHLFGTDEFGRDILSRIIFGSRIVVGVSVSATLIATIMGVILGLLAGYFGGTLDMLISRAIEILLSFPAFILAIALVAVFGANTLNVILVIAFTRTPRFARIIRGSALSVSEKEYVMSAKAIGATDIHTILFYVLPNCIGPILIYATLTMGESILTVAGLSFIGLGIQPPTPDWGVMLSRGQEYLLIAPWMAIIPGIAIFITVIGFNLIGDGLRDAIDPRND